MHIPYSTKVSIAMFIAAAFIAGAYLYQARPSFLMNLLPATAQPQATTTSQLVTADYMQPIAFDASVTPEIRTQLNTQLANLQKEIKTNPLDMRAWLNLGTVYKVGGDYAHAAVAWNFVADTVPTITAPYFNLGDLYMNFLKDYPKAEINYKKVIEIDPKVVDVYHNLYYLYIDFLKDDAKAKAILDLGLKNNPGNTDLASLLEEYNRKHAKQ